MSDTAESRGTNGCDDKELDVSEAIDQKPESSKDSFKDKSKILDLSKIQKLSMINGEINKMTKFDLVDQLKNLKLNTKGNKEVAKKRLKHFYRNQKLFKLSNNVRKQTHDYICVIDFEATCDKNIQNYLHEIIEFPAILIDTKSVEIVDIFHSYCRPILNPNLSEFCIDLTGITQEKVDSAEHFEVVLPQFTAWLSKTVGEEKLEKVAILTDGPWDMGRFMAIQCKLANLEIPKICKRWINIRKLFYNAYNSKSNGLIPMLSSFGLSFEGQLHCGLDDTKNIARIAMLMLNDGITVKVNENLESYRKKEEIIRQNRKATPATNEN